MCERCDLPSVELVTPVEHFEWVSGVSLEKMPPPLIFHVRAVGDFTWPDFIRPNSAIPLFSPRMRDAMAASGVDNIEYFPAVVVETKTGERREYVAANVIGIVAAMDRGKSEFIPARLHSVMVRSIDRLVLDMERCGEYQLFRLAEYSLLIVVSDRVAEQLKSKTLIGVRLLRPEDWDGLAD
jgi:hypothetical protein